MKNIILQASPYFQQIRREIHSNPELRYEEKQTAILVTNELKKLGLTVQNNVGKTGVVAVLDSGKPGKTVGLRADMDALPIQEETGLPYQSKYPGKMHACGHDGHTATLLAAAHVLTQMKEQLQGKIKFIFQPAEEGGAGAKAMIEDGVLDNPKVDAIFGYHNYPGSAAGTLLTKEDCVMYGDTEFKIIIQGKSGHAAMPNLAIDPIMIGSAIIQNLPGLCRQLSDPVTPDIITITRFISGIADNIIPEIATLTGTIRASSAAHTTRAMESLQKLVTSIATTYGGKATIEFIETYPATINTREATQLVLATAKKILGEEKALIKPMPARASEDFSFFLQKIPGCYFFIGNGENSASCHNSKYNFNDDILPIAAEILSAVAIAYVSN